MKQPVAHAAWAALAITLLASAAAAEPRTFQIDPSHSEVGFNIRHFFSRVNGEFNRFTGTIQYDPDDLAASTVEVVIQDSSINTGNERRDGHLRTKDFFWAEQHPTITFKSTGVTPGADADHFQIAGDLTIRGITKPVLLEVERLGIGPVVVEGNDWGTRVGFAAKTKVNRKDFEIVWNKTWDQGGAMLGDDVEIVLGIEAVSKNEPTAAQASSGGAKGPAGGKKDPATKKGSGKGQ